MWIRCLITINVGCEFCDRGSICTAYIYIYIYIYIYVPVQLLGKLANLASIVYTKPLLYKLKKNKYGQHVCM